jgi:short-subunit dehydrogenase
MRIISKPLLAGGALAGAATGLVWRQVRGQRQADEQPGPGNPFLRTYGPWALVTGAARAEGLGYSFARHLAGRGFSLALVDIAGDELAARAEELRAKYLVKVRPIVLDLGSEDSLGTLLAQTADITVGMLVCNHMWTPKNTPTIMEMDLASHMAMLDINARSYTALVHAYGRPMVERAQGGIVLVASGAGLQTTPYTGAYSANKAFQRALGEALWYELKGSGVDVLVAAPGLMDTQGDALAGYPQWMISDPDPVAVETLNALGREGPVLIPGLVNKTVMFAQTRLLPRRLAMESVGRFMADGLLKPRGKQA